MRKRAQLKAARMKIESRAFLVREAEKVNLKKWPTRVKSTYHSDGEYKNLLAEHVKQMSHFQSRHYASNRNALLLIFQGMDGAGKDGTIKHVMSGVNPQGCQVFSFKHPSETELAHDFLWRTTLDLPERGHIGIFNRSYYEEVLITRVHPSILDGEGLGNGVHHPQSKKKFWKERYRFFLHLSQEEQRKRFLSRIDNPDKNWKLSSSDIK
jgi:polyphosphate kinase 2 (PPK2 family)